jgi:REP element-mobilizing transposase RayT
MSTHDRMVIASHLVHTGYGMWLSNDLRGSGPTEIRKEDLEQLGPIHHGRKSIQPSREELQAFYRKANRLLEHDPFWIDSAKRQAVADAYREVIKRCGYTAYAFAICSNHTHGLLRRHRDDAETMWWNFATAARDELKRRDLVPCDHPVWADRPYKVFVYTPEEMRGEIEYIEKNPLKEGLVPQHYDFVTPYDDWPLHKKRR